MSIKQYDYKNVTYAVAREFARLENEAFREDEIINAYMPSHAKFDDKSLPPLAEYEALRARVQLFEKMVESTARSKYMSFKSDPRQQMFLMKGPEGRYVAGAHWVLPKYVELPSISLIQRIKNWFVQKWFNLLDFIAFKGKTNPFLASNVISEFEWASKTLGGDDTPERDSELHSMDLKQLKETTYPKDLCYYLHILCVRTDGHGKGYGKRILKDSLKMLAPYKAPPTLVGPAKASLFSAPSAKGFYVSIGLSLGAAAEHMLPNNTFAGHAYFFTNLHAQR